MYEERITQCLETIRDALAKLPEEDVEAVALDAAKRAEAIVDYINRKATRPGA